MPRRGGTRQWSLNDKIMVDTFRGQLRVRSWPRKRGPNVHPNVKLQNDWFREANRLSKIADPSQQVRAIEMTSKSGLYPRDALMRAMTAGFFDITEPDGSILTPRPKRFPDMAFAGFSMRLASNQPLKAATHTRLVWDTPVLDALQWLDPADGRFVVAPAGVAVAQFSAGMFCGSSVTGPVLINISQVGGSLLSEVREFGSGLHRIVCQTAPIPVSPGDRFFVNVWSNAANSAVAAPATYFGATVLATGLV